MRIFNEKNMKIYYLCTENNNTPVYVGSTNQSLKLRRENHLNDFRNCKEKSEWIQKEKNGGVGKHIKIVLLENCLEDERFKRENYWINFYISSGVNLFNITDAITTSDKQKETARISILKLMCNPLMKENIKNAQLRKRKKIIFNDIEYNGINEAARLTGVSAGLLCSIAKGKYSKVYKVRYV